MVWAINPRNDDMHNIVARMQTYAAPLCAAKAISFEFSSDDRIDKLNVGMTQRKNLYFIYKEAVNNALKYSGCTKVEVLLILENYVFRMVVRDNGKGFDVNALRGGSFRTLSGNGLCNMERRASEIRAVLTIDSRPGEGTMVELSFRIS
jgi:signal transduction histidine kinase